VRLVGEVFSERTMNMLVKICGNTSAEDAEYALQAGADWIGLNLVGGPREIKLAKVKRILARLDEPSRAVVLVALENGRVPHSLAHTLRDLGVRRLQVYGEVTPDTAANARQSGFEIIVVRSIAGEESLADLACLVEACGAEQPEYLLFDAAVPGQLGGTGEQADWQTIAQARGGGLLDGWPPFILAGGLTPSNVTEAINFLAPAGVDVSSGVESEPGRKDHGKITEFLAAVRVATTDESD
jgi:phosphoribosylanthranilate isomerase